MDSAAQSRTAALLLFSTLVLSYQARGAGLAQSQIRSGQLRVLRGGGWEKNGTNWVWKDDHASQTACRNDVTVRSGGDVGGGRKEDGHSLRKRAHPHDSQPSYSSHKVVKAKKSKTPTPDVNSGQMESGPHSQSAPLPPPQPPPRPIAQPSWVPPLDELDLPELPPNPPPQAPMLKDKLIKKLADLQTAQDTTTTSTAASSLPAAMSTTSIVGQDTISQAEEVGVSGFSVASLDQEIVEILRKLSDEGEIDRETWEELRRGGVKRKHLRASGLVASDDLLASLRTPESDQNIRVARRPTAPVDILGRLPAWTEKSDAGMSMVLRDPNPLAMVRVGAPNQTVAIYNPMYGRADVSYAVAVPPRELAAAQNRSKCVMTSGGAIYRDRNLEEWPQHDFRLFIGDLSQHVTDKQLTEALRPWRGFSMARVAVDKRTRMCRGFGFASFATEAEGVALIRHQRRGRDLVCVAGRPLTIKKGKWDRKVLRPEMMPAVEALREAKMLALHRGELLPDQAPIRNRAYKRALKETGVHKRVWTNDS